MSTPIIPPTFLFNVSVPCLYVNDAWSADGLQLAESYKLPCLQAELADGKQYADIRLGWHETGLFLNVDVRAKTTKPWCVSSRVDDSDRLALFIDTRDTKTVHRATKFCHHFALLPSGFENRVGVPFLSSEAIRMSSYATKKIADDTWQMVGELREDGYAYSAFISADALTGYDTSEYPRLGFSYLLNDRELGLQTFNHSIEFPFRTDPSLWGTLDLVE